LAKIFRLEIDPHYLLEVLLFHLGTIKPITSAVYSGATCSGHHPIIQPCSEFLWRSLFTRLIEQNY